MKSVTQRFSLVLSTLVLVILLAACSNTSGGGTTLNIPTPTPTPKPPTPTPTPAIVMKTYTGPAFSISYPADITESASTNASVSQVTFADSVGKNIMTIITLPNPGGTLTASALADPTMTQFNQTLLKGGQAATIGSTATVGGDTWLQRSATGDLAITDPGTQGTLVALFDVHPASGAKSQVYEIVYYGPATTFAQASTQVFQPMLQSFKFVG